MFTKNNLYMYPHASPSPHPRASANDIFLHHHHHDMLPGHYSSSAAAAAFDINGLNADPSALANHPCLLTAKASKKDRHSKIYTAQGPRDRRVRLSIGVARKFFDLQEVLGFDKPSKTLDWLLTKSKTAIKDLVQMTEKGSTDAASSECEVDSGNASEKGKSVVTSSGMLKAAAKDPPPPSNLAKESRVKARARARERTKEKMNIKKLNETRNHGGGGGYDLSPTTIPIQFMNNQLEFRKISGSSSNLNLGNDQDLIQESIVIKRKVKQYPSILGFQQNLIISSSNYGVPSPYNAAAAENWDISSCCATSQSNICAILDQHKFMNG